jgi:fatty-acyl-CoA synthase
MESNNNVMHATPKNRNLAVKIRGFVSLAEALDYAASGDTGFNFYNHRGELSTVLSYRDLRNEARSLARKLLGLGLKKGDRVGIVAETDPMFHRFFFACQYAGLIPVALPANVQLGAHKVFVNQVRRMLESCNASILVVPVTHEAFIEDIAEGLDLKLFGTPDVFDTLNELDVEFEPAAAEDIAYLQYTSGSTRFPRGVEINQATVLDNLREIAENGLKLTREDRFVSWLPYYHDMGLIGFILVPLICQLSADYLGSRTFAMRPRLWLKLISDNRGTISSSPTFGYALCARRLRPSDFEKYDLSSWRAACVGAEQINAEPLQQFAEALAPCNFDPRSFVACYGMAECVLAVSFAPLDLGLGLDHVDKDLMMEHGTAVPADPEGERTVQYADCGILLPGFGLRIVDDEGADVPERQCGQILLKGPSVMSGYFQDPEASSAVLDEDGWLNTGDIGYRVGDRLFLTARSKDVIIIKGRNIWPNDMEVVAQRIEGARLGGVAAFSVTGLEEEETAVLVLESKERDEVVRAELAQQITELMHEHFGINVMIDLVKTGSLPRTSSGKLSRYKSKLAFLERQQHRDVHFLPRKGSERKIA